MISSRRMSAAATAGPIVIGVGATGYRVASLVASRESHALGCVAVLGHKATNGPRPVPTITWRDSSKGEAHAARELCERAEGARAAILVMNLASDYAASVAPSIARAIGPHVAALAAVGVAPFSFEGQAKTDDANEMLRALAPSVDGIAIAEREAARAIVPADTPLEKACALVEDAAALAAALLARVGAEGEELGRAFADARAGCPLGAGEATGAGAVARAAQAAIEKSLLTEDRFLASAGAVLVLALGRTPTLGEIGSAEEALRERLADGASVAASFVRDPSLGERALATVLCVPRSETTTEDVFPSENPVTLEIPAFMRRRSAGLRGRGGRIRRCA
jgi:cell division GTPase FtsZ